MIGWALGAGAIGTLAVALWGAWWRSLAKGLESDLRSKSAQAEDAYRQFRELQAESAGERGRLEQVITNLKREAAIAREEFRECVEAGGSPPGAIADSLERMLATPIGGLGPPASVVLSSGPTAPFEGDSPKPP